MYLPRRSNKENQKGGSLVEIMVAVAIIAGSLVVILGFAATFLAISHVAQQTTEAVELAQESMEIVRSVRDGTNWAVDGLATFALAPAVYHAEQSGSPPAWILVSGSDTIDEFTRQIQFEQVQRDVNDDIVSSGNVDPNTIKATTTVSWQERGKNHQVELVSYFTNWN